jgi:RNA polymerase sigma factor (sigma-70 family)
MSKEKQDRFLKLYEPVHERFERFCRSRVYGDLDHEDLMNDTLLIAYDKLESLRSESVFLTFLFGIAVRVVSNKMQKHKTVKLQNEHIEHVAWKGRDAQTQTDVQILYETMRRLPDEQRECLLLFEISGFSIKEIAVIQSVTESAVKQRLKRGREKLSALLTNSTTIKKEVTYE